MESQKSGACCRDPPRQAQTPSQQVHQSNIYQMEEQVPKTEVRCISSSQLKGQQIDRSFQWAVLQPKVIRPFENSSPIPCISKGGSMYFKEVITGAVERMGYPKIEDEEKAEKDSKPTQ